MKTLDISKDQTIKLTKSQDLTAVFRGEGNNKRTAVIRFTFKGKNIESNILIRSVLFDSASIDLELILDIPKGSKGTNTYLKAETIILSENATARIVPSLEIHEDEVKAGHAATVKRIQQDHLYYLSSRGVSIEDAKSLIVEGFLESGLG